MVVYISPGTLALCTHLQFQIRLSDISIQDIMFNIQFYLLKTLCDCNFIALKTYLSFLWHQVVVLKLFSSIVLSASRVLIGSSIWTNYFQICTDLFQFGLVKESVQGIKNQFKKSKLSKTFKITPKIKIVQNIQNRSKSQSYPQLINQSTFRYFTPGVFVLLLVDSCLVPWYLEIGICCSYFHPMTFRFFCGCCNSFSWYFHLLGKIAQEVLTASWSFSIVPVINWMSIPNRRIFFGEGVNNTWSSSWEISQTRFATIKQPSIFFDEDLNTNEFIWEQKIVSSQGAQIIIGWTT